MRYKILGTGGVLAAVFIACIMSAIEFFVGHPHDLEGMLGICLPSPNLWIIPDTLSWIINLGTILVLTLSLHLFNKTYNFISSGDTVLPATFVFLCGANPWIDGLLTSSVIMMAANLICLNLLFSCYRSPKSMPNLFTVGVILSFGSMFDFAFVFMAAAFLLIAATLKCLNLKSFTAYLMGLVTPYWIGIGLGLVQVDSLSFPGMTNLFEDFATKESLFIGLLNAAVTVLFLLILILSNAVKLYAGNTKRRLMNNAIVILGLAVSICMVCDADNITTYFATLYFVLASQLANFFVLHNVKQPALLIGITILLYLVGCILMVLGYFPTLV